MLRGRFSNRKSNTLHNILKANCQLFFLTQFVRLFFVLPCTLSLTEFVRLYFVLQPQVFQLVVRQPLTQSCGCFSLYNFQLFNRCFLFHCFIPRRSHPRIEFSDLASHRFQFGFTCAAIAFYSSSYLQLLGSFFKLSIVIQCSLVYKLTFFLLKKYYISFRKKNICNTVSGLISQSRR